MKSYLKYLLIIPIFFLFMLFPKASYELVEVKYTVGNNVGQFKDIRSLNFQFAIDYVNSHTIKSKEHYFIMLKPNAGDGKLYFSIYQYNGDMTIQFFNSNSSPLMQFFRFINSGGNFTDVKTYGFNISGTDLTYYNVQSGADTPQIEMLDYWLQTYNLNGLIMYSTDDLYSMHFSDKPSNYTNYTNNAFLLKHIYDTDVSVTYAGYLYNFLDPNLLLFDYTPGIPDTYDTVNMSGKYATLFYIKDNTIPIDDVTWSLKGKYKVVNQSLPLNSPFANETESDVILPSSSPTYDEFTDVIIDYSTVSEYFHNRLFDGWGVIFYNACKPTLEESESCEITYNSAKFGLITYDNNLTTLPITYINDSGVSVTDNNNVLPPLIIDHDNMSLSSGSIFNYITDFFSDSDNAVKFLFSLVTLLFNSIPYLFGIIVVILSIKYLKFLYIKLILKRE